MHDVLMITYRRAEFARRSLETLLEGSDREMRVWIWQNGDHAETCRVVDEFRHHPRVHRIHRSPDNQRLRAPTNWFFRESTGQFVSKVDDDCLVPSGWQTTLRAAHESGPRLGVIGCWRFYDEDLRMDYVSRKLQEFGPHKVMVHGFVQGSGYVMKRDVYNDCGPIRDRESFTSYCLRAASRGWVNGWYFPFLHEDHMDDARSAHYPFKTEAEFSQNLSLSQKNFGIATLEDWRRFSRLQALNLQRSVIDPRDYVGWRNLLRRLRSRIAPETPFWKQAEEPAPACSTISPPKARATRT